MTKKHFVEVAKMIKLVASPQDRANLAKWFAGWFERYNKKFDKPRFFSACGIYPECTDFL